MNMLVLKKFTPEILHGAKALGFEFDWHRGILRAKEAEDIEQRTGRSIGELALLGIESNASAEQRKLHRKLLRETMELMSAFDSRPLAEQAAGG
jgi:hypothetical protein